MFRSKCVNLLGLLEGISLTNSVQPNSISGQKVRGMGKTESGHLQFRFHKCYS